MNTRARLNSFIFFLDDLIFSLEYKINSQALIPKNWGQTSLILYFIRDVDETIFLLFNNIEKLHFVCRKAYYTTILTTN